MRVKSIRNIRIKTKLILLGAISIAGLLLMGGESVITGRQINQASTDISQSWLPSVIIAEELNSAISDYRLQENYHVIAKNKDAMEKSEQEMELLRQKIADGFASYTQYITNKEDETMMRKAETLWQYYLACSDRLLEVSRSNRTEDALEMMRGESQVLFDEAGALFAKVVEFNKNGAEAASIHGDKLYASLAGNKILVICLIGAFITILVIYIIRAIEKPVEAITDCVRRVANGDLGVQMDYKSDDEIGALTSSVNALVSRLNNIIRDEKYLLQEIGNKNYHAESNCEQAYQGDFAPILYSITSMRSRLEQYDLEREGTDFKSKPEYAAKIERIQIKRPIEVEED